MYEITYTKQALKELEKLEKDTQERILKTLERIRVRPHSHVKKLVASPYFRLRAGDYRVILDVQNKNLVILVIEIGHRKNIYK